MQPHEAQQMTHPFSNTPFTQQYQIPDNNYPNYPTPDIFPPNIQNYTQQMPITLQPPQNQQQLLPSVHMLQYQPPPQYQQPITTKLQPQIQFPQLDTTTSYVIQDNTQQTNDKDLFPPNLFPFYHF